RGQPLPIVVPKTSDNRTAPFGAPCHSASAVVVVLAGLTLLASHASPHGDRGASGRRGTAAGERGVARRRPTPQRSRPGRWRPPPSPSRHARGRPPPRHRRPCPAAQLRAVPTRPCWRRGPRPPAPPPLPCAPARRAPRPAPVPHAAPRPAPAWDEISRRDDA